MRSILCFFTFLVSIFVAGAQSDAVYVKELNLSQLVEGKIHRFWLEVGSDGLSQPIHVPVMVAKGTGAGPVLGLIAAVHGNELNGIAIIQKIFATLDPAGLKGTLIGVPGVNAVSLLLDQRRFIDGEDLNRVFPGETDGDNSQQYAFQVSRKLLPHFDLLIDMHTASFGRVNSLYVRTDPANDTLNRMAYLQNPDIILHSKGPSVGRSGGTIREEALLQGIPAITVEYGNPQVYQKDMIERGVTGVFNTMSWLGMVERPVQPAESAPAVCKRSYWIYVEEGGLLDGVPELAQKVKKGEIIGILRNPFGDIIREYRAPEDGIVIGKSTNPVNMSGGRILQLGILVE